MKTQPDCVRENGDGSSLLSKPYDANGDGYDWHTSWREGGLGISAMAHQLTYHEPLVWTVQELPGISIISRAVLEDFMDVMGKTPRRVERKE